MNSINLTRNQEIALGVGAFIVFAAIVLLAMMAGGASAKYTPMTANNISTALLTKSIPDSTTNAVQLRLGQYMIRAGDCMSCHTKDGGSPFAGGFGLNTPFGTIYSTNITSDSGTGIGAWTPDQFYKALHDGSGSHGAIYPAMPYNYLTRMTRADSDAMLAYLKTIPAVSAIPPANDLAFPFNIRFLVHGWNLLFFSSGTFEPDASKSAEWNRGAYLVTGASHCGACHTPKNFLAGDKTSKALHGGVLDNWTAPDLTGNARTGLGSWTAADIAEYLKTGRNARANAGGSMAEVVSYSTSLLSDADRNAIAIYLKDQPASPDATVKDVDAGAMTRGAAIYSDTCSACHMESAGGQPRFFPPLRGNAVAQQSDPTSLLHIILAGDRTATTVTRPSPLTMPSFGWKLTDQQIADVATYIRNSWGNHATPVTEKQASDTRKKLGLTDVRLTNNSGDRD